LVDTKASKVFIEKEIVKCIDLVKNGVHGVLFVVSVKNRFTPEEAGVLDSLQLLFGANSLNYVVVVFTSGDALEGSGITLEEYLNDCPPQLQWPFLLLSHDNGVWNGLAPGEYLTSPDQRIRLEMERDCNLILTDTQYSRMLWHSNTTGDVDQRCFLCLQPDGKLGYI
ncbi:hypothetical protein KI387_002520, partial [Taxus chinensis]